MKLLAKLERHLGWIAVPNLTVYLVFGQVCMFIVCWAQEQRYTESRIRDLIRLYPDMVLSGEIWRLFTFIFDPPFTNPLFALFGFWFFWMMGTALENQWGAFRYTLYLLIGYVATVAVAFLVPAGVATNGYLGGSVFLAFAYLWPEFMMYIYFVLPVKAKWIATLTWVMYGIMFIVGGMMTKLMIAASVLNFLLFFASDIIQMIKSGKRKMTTQVQRIQDRDKPFHTCAVCGITDKTHPKMDFRYCPLCRGSWGYCEQHINNHAHKFVPPESEQKS